VFDGHVRLLYVVFCRIVECLALLARPRSRPPPTQRYRRHYESVGGRMCAASLAERTSHADDHSTITMISPRMTIITCFEHLALNQQPYRSRGRRG